MENHYGGREDLRDTFDADRLQRPQKWSTEDDIGQYAVAKGKGLKILQDILLQQKQRTI